MKSVVALLRIKVWRPIRFFWQRMFRGFDDSATWSLDGHLARLIVPRLKQFREQTIGVPWQMSSMDEWHDTLDEMIRAFEFIGSNAFYSDPMSFDPKPGLELFAKHYCSLWW